MAVANKQQQEAQCDVEALVAEFLEDPARTSLELPPMSAALRKKAKALADGHPELQCESFGLGSERRLHLFKAGKAAATSPGAASPVSVKNTFIDDWAPAEGAGDAELVQFRSMPVQLPVGAAGSRAAPDSPSKVNLSSCSLIGGGMLDLSPISESTPKWPREMGASQKAPALSMMPTQSSPNPGLPRLLGGNREGVQVRNTFVHFDSDTQDDRTVQSMPHDMFRRCLEEEAALRAAEAASKPPPGMPPTPTAPSCRAPMSPHPMRMAGGMLSVPAPQAAQMGHSAMLIPGMHVVIQGLTKLPAFNGQRGVIETFNEATGRYKVVLLNPVPGVPKSAKVKGDNLLIDTMATAAAAVAAASAVAAMPPPPRASPFAPSLDASCFDMAAMSISGLPSVPSTPLWGEDIFGSSPLRLTQLV